MPKVELDVRNIDRGIRLKEVDSVAEYLDARGITIDYQKFPERLRSMGPDKAPLYTRTFSLIYTEPQELPNIWEYEDSVGVIRRLDNLVQSLEGKEGRCASTLRETYSHNGKRLAAKVRNIEKEIKMVEDEKTRWPKFVADVILLRGLSSAGTYGIFEGPLGDYDVDVAGMKMKGRDIALIAASSAFAATSVGSYFWARKKIRDFRIAMRDGIETVYRQAILESVNDAEKFYPTAVERETVISTST